MQENTEYQIDSWINEPPYEFNTIETPEMKALGFNIGTISVNSYEDVEDKAGEYFASCGFSVVNLKKKHSDVLSNEFPFFEDIDTGAAGVPDLFVFRVFDEVTFGQYNHQMEVERRIGNYRFVEVKSENDGLRPSQMRWMAKHNHYPIDVVIVEQEDDA